MSLILDRTAIARILTRLGFEYDSPPSNPPGHRPNQNSLSDEAIREATGDSLDHPRLPLCSLNRSPLNWALYSLPQATIQRGITPPCFG
ncbi:MAG: hypothetical protein ACI8QS_002049 [Planctomycetota bacterium]|jgi:hypothetical protein